MKERYLLNLLVIVIWILYAIFFNKLLKIAKKQWLKYLGYDRSSYLEEENLKREEREKMEREEQEKIKKQFLKNLHKMNSLEEEFVPNEIALAMREIGFDEPCLKYKWNDNEKPHWMSRTNKPNFYHRQDFWKDCDFEGNHVFTISIPTYSQCFNWFRKNKILGLINPIDDWNSWSYSILSNDCMSPFFEMAQGLEYKSFEEAQLEGLKQMIKLQSA